MRKLASVLAAAVMACGPVAAQGVFLGAEMVPWRIAEGAYVVPAFTFGWEGPLALQGVGFVATFGVLNPVVLNDWYMGNLSVFMLWPRTDNVRVGVGVEVWAEYASGRLVNGAYSINGTVQLRTGPARIYSKAHLPVPIPTGAPYLGVTLTIGGYILLPPLFGNGGG